ncbi:MAG: Uma2 family endonuclease [Deltaproteobacteria bacterium]|nr:Uma2 family endonuclease [Deltaproteobacteria bacterium]
MTGLSARNLGRGPFTADSVSEGAPYELSNGHAIQCMPTGGRGARANLIGAAVLETDPLVTEAGVDVGYSSEAHQLRAPDVAIGNVPDEPSWVRGVPPLAVEYADRGQDDEELERKIAELLAAGTKWIWVVRLAGPRRVEVHQPGLPARLVRPGELLEAPGVLKNPVRVEELYDADAAHDAMLRNLIQRQGYTSLKEALAQAAQEGRSEGRNEGRNEAARALFLRRLGRAARPDEARMLEERLETVGAEAVQDAAVDAKGEALAAWLQGGPRPQPG